jgi:Cd2+/Zn2+-exporting ATPase
MNTDPDELLSLAVAVQVWSEHHLARATVSEAEDRALGVSDARRFQSEAGKRVCVDVETVLEDAVIEWLEPGLDRLRSLESGGKEERSGRPRARGRRSGVRMACVH